MIRSMTGFGRSEQINAQYKLIVEMKAVNYKTVEYNIKLPRKLYSFESKVRKILSEYISRGKVDVFITYEDYTEMVTGIKYNPQVAAAYLQYMKEMSESFGLEQDVTVSQLARFPDVFTKDELGVDEEQLWGILEQGIRKACEEFCKNREAEGKNLLEDLLSKLDFMQETVEFIEAQEPNIIQSYRLKLEEKVKELIGTNAIEEGRIAAEVVLYADKICVDEETVRLRSHIMRAREILQQEGSIGRNLDILAQEMNRESNTILSKSNSLEISNRGIDLKTCVEKVREQIQNIE